MSKRDNCCDDAAITKCEAEKVLEQIRGPRQKDNPTYQMPDYKTVQRYEVEFRHESTDVFWRFYQELTPIMDRFGVYGQIKDEDEIDVQVDDENTEVQS